MSNIWKENQNVKENPNRNTFDLSFQNHLTMKLGTLYPVFCKEVNPGDSFRIKTAFGLKFMPMVFPVQSKMKAYMHFFYVRNKNIWENWENFISGLETHTHPYIDQPSSFFRTGSLSDYLDVPTTLVTLGDTKVTHLQANHNIVGSISAGSRIGTNPSTGRSTSDPIDIGRANVTDNSGSSVVLRLYTIGLSGAYSTGDSLLSKMTVAADPSYGLYLFDNILEKLPSTLGDSDSCPFTFFLNNVAPNSTDITNVKLCFFKVPEGADINRNFNFSATNNRHTVQEFHTYGSIVLDSQFDGSLDLVDTYPSIQFVPTSLADFNAGLRSISIKQSNGDRFYVALFFPYAYKSGALTGPFPLPGQSPSAAVPYCLTGKVSYFTQKVVDSDPVVTPFGNDSTNGIHLNALPYRAYESVYNAWYRNTQNQPMFIEGVEAFNKYNTTLADGADDTPYALYQRNYEMDFLTSAMPSPQFGNAPLVGLNPISGTITLEDDSVIKYEAGLDSGDLSKTKLSFTSSDGSTVATTDIPQLGMAISDFRGVNALQHFLEMTLRHGYKYRDFIEGHFGSAPKDQVLDMPEFIGGVSQPVTVGQITNMSPTDSMPLGAFGGQANCFGMSQNDIIHYCDDFGWIIGIMSIVPEPAYSQLLPKHFLHDSQLDYYFPEFSQLGLQSVDYREVCPLQKYEEQVGGSGSLLDTFGYQRPNYDLVAYTNQVHGLFRTQLSNFLFNRKFASAPQLGNSFLQINPAELNDVFVVTESSEDVVTGQIIFDVVAKRPVPRVNVPSLGR